MTFRQVGWLVVTIAVSSTPGIATAETRIRIMPADGAVLAAGQLFDIRVEATADGTEPPTRLKVLINGKDVTSGNVLAPGAGGERGVGGTGTDSGVTSIGDRAGPAAANTTNFLLRRFSVSAPGAVTIEARTGDGASAQSKLMVERWGGPAASRRARNIILLLGDGMSVAHRTAARIVSKGLKNGKAAGHLAMDTLDVTGLVMTSSLNAVITDSSPGMSSYVTGQKAANNQEGIYPDNTGDAFDNPRVEYIGELLRRTRGSGFNVGIVTTADVTDSTPAANAAHTSDRFAGAGIAAQFFDERASNGVSVLLGGGARHFMPKDAGGERGDGRKLADEFTAAGYQRVSTATEVKTLIDGKSVPARCSASFIRHIFRWRSTRSGRGNTALELAQTRNAAYRDTPMLDDLARLAIPVARRELATRVLPDDRRRVDRQAGAHVRRRTHDLGRDRVRLSRRGGARICQENEQRRGYDERYARDRDRRPRDRRSGARRRRERALRSRATRPRRSRDYAAVFRFDPDSS